MKQIQHVLKLGRTVCYQTLMRHAAGEPLVQRHPPRDRSRLGPTQLAGLRSLSRYNEDAYLVELQEKLHVVYGNKYSLSLICRALAKLGLRSKKVCTQLPGGQLPREPGLLSFCAARSLSVCLRDSKCHLIYDRLVCARHTLVAAGRTCRSQGRCLWPPFGGGQDVVAVVLLRALPATSGGRSQRRHTLAVVWMDTAHQADHVVALQEGERVASGKSALTVRSGSGGSARPHTCAAPCAPAFRRSPTGVHTGSSDSMPASREAVSLAGLASRSRVRRVTRGSGRLLPGATECSRAAETVLEGGDGAQRPKSLSRLVANSLTRFPGNDRRLSAFNWKLQ